MVNRTPRMVFHAGLPTDERLMLIPSQGLLNFSRAVQAHVAPVVLSPGCVAGSDVRLFLKRSRAA
jgi:hypothetical protein